MRSYSLVCILLLSLACAARYSVTYDKRTETFEVVSGQLRGAVATLTYEDNIDTTGWGQIRVETSERFSDEVQAKAAGFVEGFVEHERIYQHVSNIRAINFKGEPVPEGIKTYLAKQIEFIYGNIEHPPKGEKLYWRHVNLIMKQLEGLVDGYNKAAPADKAVSFQDMYMHNADGDMETLLDIYKPEEREWLEMLDCSALVRMREDGEIMVGHATWRNFAAMLRHYKYYDFHYSLGEVRVSFSASPGFINSKDDFYVNGNGIATMETTNAIFDEKLYKACVPESVPSFIRSQLSNRLAQTPQEWVETFSLWNSGTYNNQWMAVDLNGYGKKENVMWIVEQIPGETIMQDVTSFLYKDGYWASYNIPFFAEVREKSGYNKQPQVPDNDYYNCSRHNIFKRDAPGIQTLEEFKKIMRSNNYLSDPLAEKNPKHTIAARYDLFEEKPRHFGSIDSKVTSTSLHKKNMGVFMASGPSTDGCPAFSWSEWMKTHEAVQHIGHPDRFDFDYVYRDFE